MRKYFSIVNERVVKTAFLSVLLINVLYFVRVYSSEEIQLTRAALAHAASTVFSTDDQIEFPKDVPLEEITEPKQRISYLLHEVDENKDGNYWLAHTNVKHSSLKVKSSDFLPSDSPNWQNRPELFFDPRFTLSIYLDELKHQLLSRNPNNEKSLDSMISMPFAWSDWVDLTMLNEELSKPIDERRDCEWLQSKVNKPTKRPFFCVNLKDATDEEIEETGMTRENLPGFLVKTSPMNKAPHKQVMMQGKAHLYAYQQNPFTIIFLTKSGTYEAQIRDNRKRLVHTDMFENYLSRRGINPNHLEDYGNEIVLNPYDEFSSLLTTIAPRPLNWDDDIHRMNAITQQTEVNASRELHLDTESFNYKREAVLKQLHDYQYRLDKLEEAFSNELRYSPDVFKEFSLDRHEYNHYSGLKCASETPIQQEPTYYKLATLLKNKDNVDAGWHYEWRFFNGALRYAKDNTWTMNQLEIREQIILDRLLRNWFRFAEQKGIISWIAHGPLLSWYWDGLMFPFDIDIDIQMPSAELNRLSRLYNMTLVVEDIEEGYGKYLIDCSTYMHHRDMAYKDNHIDARFIDVDTGTYIDITGIGKNNENPPPEYDSYIRSKNAKGESVELYMDRRKHWLNFEKISPLRYSSVSGVPVYIPNDVMSMLNTEYSHGTSAFHFDGYYYVPCVRLWIQQAKVAKIFNENDYKVGDKIDRDKLLNLVVSMKDNDKARLLESDEELLMEYYLTHKHTSLHQVEKKFLLDAGLQHSIIDLHNNYDYHMLTSNFKMGKALRKSLFDFEYFERFEHDEYLPAKGDEPAKKIIKPKVKSQHLAAGKLEPIKVVPKPDPIAELFKNQNPKEPVAQKEPEYPKEQSKDNEEKEQHKEEKKAQEV